MRGSSLSSAWPAWQALERFKGLLAASDHDKEDAATSYTRYGGEDRCLCRYLRWCSFNETQARLPPRQRTSATARATDAGFPVAPSALLTLARAPLQALPLMLTTLAYRKENGTSESQQFFPPPNARACGQVRTGVGARLTTRHEHADEIDARMEGTKVMTDLLPLWWGIIHAQKSVLDGSPIAYYKCNCVDPARVRAQPRPHREEISPHALQPVRTPSRAAVVLARALQVHALVADDEESFAHFYMWWMEKTLAGQLESRAAGKNTPPPPASRFGFLILGSWRDTRARRPFQASSSPATPHLEVRRRRVLFF